MSTKTKKKVVPGAIKTTAAGKTGILSGNLFFPALFIFLYLMVDFVPELGSADIMGTQWLYLGFLNLLCLGYILWDKKLNQVQAIRSVTSNLLSLLYGSLFILSGLSILVAENKIESLVCYARFTVTLIAYLNLAILLYGRMNLFPYLAQVLSIVLLLQSVSVIAEFFKGYGETDLNKLILGLKGNAGNKNILAASLVIKLPFAFYCIYNFRLASKFFHVLPVVLATFAIVILNARASYISTLLVFGLYILFCFLSGIKKDKKAMAKNIAFVVLPVLIGFLIAQAVFKNALEFQENSTAYGTVAERLSSIKLSSEGTSYRILQWNSALDYIKHHPLMGAGYGNWKLASIPYEITFSNDLLVTYHVHNDFLEISSEAGILGGILLLSVFIVAGIYAVKTLRLQLHNGSGNVAAFSLMALAVYFIDAFFNFPTERPIMQLFFVLILALIINQYLQNSVTKTDNKTPANQSTKNLFAFICLLLLLPALWFTYTTYNSLVAQKDINSDVLLANPVKSFEEVDNELPSIPNLNAFCFPVDAIRARYLMKEKKYDDALALINKAEAVNPYLPYGEFLKAQLFLEVNKMDSARRYAVAAFAKRPRSLANLQILNFISYKAKDTATLNRNFEIFTSYRKDQPAAWNDYLKYLHELPHDQNKFQALVDSALKLFPDDPELRQKKSGLFVNSNSPAVQAAAPYVIKALEAFNRKDYAVAIHNFAKAGELNPTDYTNWENIGVCYYVQNNFSVATGYFEKAIGLRTAVDGKSEFFNGICLINLGKKPEGCHYLQLADAKNYPGAKAQQAAFCQ